MDLEKAVKVLLLDDANAYNEKWVENLQTKRVYDLEVSDLAHVAFHVVHSNLLWVIKESANAPISLRGVWEIGDRISTQAEAIEWMSQQDGGAEWLEAYNVLNHWYWHH